MPDSTHDPLNESDDILAGSLGRLPREMMPPDSLEERTVATLRGAGLIQPRSRAGLTLASWVLAASIGAIAFIGGSVISKQKQAAQQTFAFTLVGGQLDDSATNANRAAEYEAWSKAISATPKARDGIQNAPLSGGDPGSISSAIVNGDSVIVDDLIPSAGKRIPDVYLISAPTRDSAYKLAEKCPHLKYGGRVVIQQIAGIRK